MSSRDSFEVYKYRRRSDRNDLFMYPSAFTKRQDLVNVDDEPEQVQKNFAILIESRSEVTNRKLRYALLIYSTPAWKLFILSVLITSYVLDTWLYTFCEIDSRPFGIVILVICLNIIFTIDVCIVFGLKIFKKWRKTLNLVEPDTGRVIVDVALAVPYSMLYLVNYEIYNFDYHAIPPIAAIIRDYRILEYFYNKSSEAGSNQWTTFLFQYLVLLLISVHSWTCVWYLLSYGDFDINKIRMSWSVSATHLPTETTFDWYYVCAYWSIMILTTNALGDLYPVSAIERVPAIFAVILGFLLTTIVFVGSLTSQFLTITTRRSQYVRQLMKIQNHLQLIKMDSDTTKRIMRYYEDLWYQKSGVFKPKLIDLLPYPLQMEICYDLNAVPLYSSLIFRKLPEPFLRRLSLAMTHQFYLPGDVVYNHGQNKTFMVCISNGVLELLSDEDDESPMISFTKGTCFGEIALIYNVPARCTVKAATYVECQVLEKTEFIRLMMRYPELTEQIRNEINNRIRRSLKIKDKSSDQLILTLNIYASKERKKSRIKCLKDRLRYLQGLSDTNTVTKEDKLDEHCIDLYILSEHVKKKTSVFTSMNVEFPWILEADCYLVKYWEIYMLVVVFYISLVYPYYIGFIKSFPEGLFKYTEIVITISLVINLMVCSVTAIRTKKKYIRKWTTILNYRMNTLGFYLDMIALIPFEYLVIIKVDEGYTDNHKTHLFYLCKGVKLCLIWRLSNFFEKLEKPLLYNTILVKVIKYAVYILLLCYWCGVILFMEACFVPRCSEDSWFANALRWDHDTTRGGRSHRTEYPHVIAVYFATTLLLSVGYGDLAPGDQYDMALVAFISLYGVLLVGYCVAEFSAIITHVSRTKTAFVEVIITIDKFMKDNNMHSTIQTRIMSFYELQWQYNSAVELTGDNWLDKTVVPSELRKKVLHQARFKVLTSTRFFQVRNKAFIHTLSEMARDIILPPGEVVYYGGTITRELYIVESGYCLVTSPTLKEKKQERVIGPGNHLGLLVLLYGVPAVSSVVTLTHCKLINISHAAYSSALSLFPDMKEHEGLLTSEELASIVPDSIHHAEGFADATTNKSVHVNNKMKFSQFLQDFANHSLINVYKVYKNENKSYLDSYKQFKHFNTISRYLLMPIVLKPHGALLRAWVFIRIIASLILCFIVPLNIAMAPQCGAFIITIQVLDIICYIDLYIMAHVATYGSKNQLIYHPYLTAKHYLRGPFLLDFLTCFPWHAILKLIIPTHDENHTPEDHFLNGHMSHCIVRMITVFQIYKLYVAFWADSINELKRAYLTSVLQFLIVTLFFLNLYTCILLTMTCQYVKAKTLDDFQVRLKSLSIKGPYIETHFQAEGNMICQLGSWIDRSIVAKDDILTPSEAYLIAFYWAAASFTGAGFGDVTAQDTKHMVLTICVVIHGTFFFGYVYARIASLKAMADQVTTKFQENLKHLELFLTRENVPLFLKRTVTDYWKYQWKRTGGWSHQSILGKLHANLNEDAVLYMYEKTLREIPLFEDVEYSFFRAFAKKLDELYFQKGYMVMRANEVMSGIFIIYRGKVDILSEYNEPEVCMGPGGIFGNIKGASKYLTLSTVVASRNIDLLCIDGAAFYALLKSYPSVHRKVNMCVATASKDYVLPTICFGTARNFTETAQVNKKIEDLFADEEETDSIDFLESPEKSVSESHGSKSMSSVANASDFTYGPLLIVQPHKWFKRSIQPDSKFVTYMDFLILLLSYVDFISVVYQMSFFSFPHFLYTCIIIDCIFIYKIFLDVHTGFMNRYGDYVYEPKKLRKMYFSKVLHRRRDFMANFPICYLSFSLPLSPAITMGLFTYLRLPQLFRITYLMTYQTHRKIGSSNLFLKLVSIGIWASLISHVNACVFFKLSCLTPVKCQSANWISKQDLNLFTTYHEGDYFSIYIASLWYMINLLTITGTGDVSSQNELEVVETVIIAIIIKFGTGLLISEMSAMITAHTSSRITYDHEINELRDGLRDMDLSEHQMNKMWDYVRELWNRQQGRQMPELVHQLPFRLRCQVMQAVYGSHIRESIIFTRAEEDFQRMLAMWMRHCVFFPGNYIVQCGDSDQSIYFIHRGEVEVLTVHPNLTESIYDVLGPEDSFGMAQGLYVGVSHHFSFRARTVVDVVYLKLGDWKFLLDFYPKAAKTVVRKVENVYLAV